MKKDYYEILGVPRTADDKELKAAYRRLARKFHPDVNKGEKQAEERFKEVAEAFAVLSDKDKRARYDGGGHEAFGPGFDPFAGFDPSRFGNDLGDLSSVLEMFGFGGTARRSRRPRARRPADVRLELRVSFATAVTGQTIEVGMPRAGTAERVKVRIPPGIADGDTLRLAGQGNGGGDAYLTVRVDPHPVFRRDGRDLQCEVSLGVAQATLGGKVEIETLDGKATIAVPPGTHSGQKLRLRGRGVPASNGKPAGDLYVVVQIQPPKALDARSRELMEEFARLEPDNLTDRMLHLVHPALVHFSVAFIVAGGCAEVWGLGFRHDRSMRWGSTLVLVGLASLVPTLASGYLAANTLDVPLSVQPLLEAHERNGWILLGTLCGAQFWKGWCGGRIPDRLRWLYAALMLAAVGLAAYGAWLGGRMVYGAGIGVA